MRNRTLTGSASAPLSPRSPSHTPRYPSPLRLDPRRRKSHSPAPSRLPTPRPRNRLNPTQPCFDISYNPHFGALLFDRHNIGVSATPALDYIDELEYIQGIDDFPLSIQSLENPPPTNDIFPLPAVMSSRSSMVAPTGSMHGDQGALPSTPVAHPPFNPVAHKPTLPAGVSKELWPVWADIGRTSQVKELLKSYDELGREVRNKEAYVHNGMFRILDRLVEAAWLRTSPTGDPPFAVNILATYTTHSYVHPGKIPVKEKGEEESVSKGKKRAIEEGDTGDEKADSRSGATRRASKRRAGIPDISVTYNDTVRCLAEAKKPPKPNANGQVTVSVDDLIGYDNQVRRRLNSAISNGSHRLWAISCVSHYIRPYFWQTDDSSALDPAQGDHPDRAYPGTVRPSNAGEIHSESRNGGVGPSFDDWYDLKLESTKLLLQQMAVDILNDSAAYPDMYGPSGEGAWQHEKQPRSSPLQSPSDEASAESQGYKAPRKSGAIKAHVEGSGEPRRSERVSNRSARRSDSG